MIPLSKRALELLKKHKCISPYKYEPIDDIAIDIINCIVAEFDEISKHYKCPEPEISPEKEPELMTFFEAWEKAKEGDKVIDKHGNFVINGGTDCTYPISILIAKTWQIIPAQPKVLNREEYIKRLSRNVMDYRYREDEYIEDFNAGYKKGEEDQYLNHQELIKLLRMLYQDSMIKGEDLKYTDIKEYLVNIGIELENLKPLKAE